jgi:1,4-alpha-glucan branching enzyme
MLSSLTTRAQLDPEKVCRIENGQLIFTLNLKWTEKEKKEISMLFDLDSALIAQVYNGKTSITIGVESWKTKKLQANLVELSKSVQTKADKNIKANDLFLVIDSWTNFAGNTTESTATFGVNNFEVSNAFVYSSNTAKFYLPGYKSAQKVYISGTFNNWSTTQTPMKQTANGWMIDLKIKPGKYAYKFIADGRWMTDPSNKLRERGDAGAYNSIVFCYNHLFELKGYKNARKVVVTGNFYDWNPRGLPMNPTAEGWSLPMYLRDGTYAYKFLVDGDWMTDPANKELRADASGNMNSFIGIGEPYIFKLDGFTTVKKMVLTGSFNGWNETELVMNKTAKGWQLPYVVAAGNYEYKFIADGKWMIDPANPFTSGSGDTQNSFIALKANHIFELSQSLNAKSVIVTGSFNGWNTQGYRMVKQGGKWILPIYLSPGKYTYKFIVDDNWILDPANKLYEQNEYNTNNSVLWVEPAK